jgi:hypothetical protein
VSKIKMCTCQFHHTTLTWTHDPDMGLLWAGMWQLLDCVPDAGSSPLSVVQSRDWAQD